MANLPKLFKTYLKIKGLSPVTIRNYSADLNHFLAWLELTLRSQNIALNRSLPELIISFFEPNYLTRYKKYLIQNRLPISTINRRLSTLRNFGSFCVSQAWLQKNPAEGISNMALEQTTNLPHRQAGGKEWKEKILNSFKRSLEEEKASPITIKNYLSDIRSFLAWVELAT